ncbi:hypothetical protein [Deinococcus altitudinis]|uniref:hypothetical protein n=1 Tax=Deinococcus altitudinis TaxID=468914 RepID=UPI003891A418
MGRVFHGWARPASQRPAMESTLSSAQRCMLDINFFRHRLCKACGSTAGSHAEANTGASIIKRHLIGQINPYDCSSSEQSGGWNVPVSY